MRENPFDKPLRFLKGVGEKRAQLFAKLGLATVRDLLTHFPRDYEDRTAVRTIARLVPGEAACVVAMVAEPPRHVRVRAGLDYVRTRVVDGQRALSLVFFNAPYVKDALREGETYVFFGKIEEGRREMQNPVFEPIGRAGQVTGRILPVYPLCAGLSRGQVLSAVRQALDEVREHWTETLPDGLRARYGLCYIRYAYENIHFPASPEDRDTARSRLVFEELLTLSLGLRRLKQQVARAVGAVVPPVDIEKFYAAIPFAPTAAQRRVVGEVLADMAAGRPMSRLVQGDVGSGKTLVAAVCAAVAVKNGYQAALMAPTELLAEQHHRTWRPLLAPLGVETLLLTGRLTPAQKRDIRRILRSELPVFVIGTHALLSEGVDFGRLGLVIADEQHRFGVAQRSRLTEKGDAPHLLVMSATPIPRTLALIIYGDLHISVLDEKPPGRRKVDTFAVGESVRPRIENFVRRLVAEGRQVYVVCPFVEESGGAEGPRAAEAYAETLRRQVYPALRVGLVHGKMPPARREAAMRAFVEGALDILVATTVIEVGVDVPNAALMVVENAERFGLSQLHQLRGRVGRGQHKSYCVLFSRAFTEATRARLAVMTETDDGFVIAERDLAMRGPGDFFGHRQHGLPNLRVADLAVDMTALSMAAEAAGQLLEEDAALSQCPALREAVDRLLAGQVAV
ncbi:MAG: ATP-dependent DNA helicase RecG [Oscillospiraceae bacterium]|jgi:ATP-dependent DNA helicase RecG|nr:ATP-dependent DNA helicase RecG [Oscillospiraceae bacterium]